MGVKNPKVDAYIAKSPDFAKPILRHLREIVHAACPGVVEEMKWSAPHFSYHGMFCGMASFKAHCVFGFWKAALLKKDFAALGLKTDGTAMGGFGRITTLKDLPSDTKLKKLIKAAAKINEAGIVVPKGKKPAKKAIPMPSWFKAALAKNRKALATFEAFSPSHKREYLEWLTGAKTEATREKRVATALEWLAEGKARHWKYMKK